MVIQKEKIEVKGPNNSFNVFFSSPLGEMRDRGQRRKGLTGTQVQF